MIKFTLNCADQHVFECWFPNSDSLSRQLGLNLVDCPICGSVDVVRPLSAPNLSTPKTRSRSATPDHIDPSQIDSGQIHLGQTDADERQRQQTKQVTGPVTSGVAVPPPSDVMRSMLRDMQKLVERDFTHVGDDFAAEARKIYSGEAEAENIYGNCTPDEQAELEEEGITVGVLPWLPPDN
ncbi:DUF1178 family protein [Alphaproteobacteria bacterium]|nr:DUF1178 family protein [Alphaproteobacteria bacterium]